MALSNNNLQAHLDETPGTYRSTLEEISPPNAATNFGLHITS